MELFWGDIRNPTHVLEAVKDIEGIVHLARPPPLEREEPGNSPCD